MTADALDTDEQVRARLAELEHAISWETTCLNCSALLDRSYADYEKIEKLEGEVRNQREIVEYAHRLLDDEPYLLSWVRIALMPLSVVRFLAGAARSKL